ncbi:unnamed protein product [marine sediment metagenome]|uniref:Uncharacterized protein n=1 Tax=marine sediment metagenome TaxID=412755 RepID=X1U3C0_9ZZZZ
MFFIAPAVDPAQPPMNMRRRRIPRDRGGQRSKFWVVNPVVVFMETT